MNSAKIAYEQNLVKSRNLKFLFKYIQSIKGSLRQDIKLQDSTGLIITEPTNIANILNNLFASKRNLNTISCVKPLILTEQSKVKISVDIFTNALIKIKKSNSVGPDKIPVTFWKHKEHIKYSNSVFIQSFFRTMLYPPDLENFYYYPYFQK